MTVYELRDACDKAIAQGYGDRNVWISQDDEGNSFHRLEYEFTVDNIGDYRAWGIDTINPDTDILLG